MNAVAQFAAWVGWTPHGVYLALAIAPALAWWVLEALQVRRRLRRARRDAVGHGFAQQDTFADTGAAARVQQGDATPAPRGPRGPGPHP